MFTREAIASFNELECSLYGYISKNAEKVAYMRIRELADETHVSTSTILRFCRKVDCAGYSEFKVKLKMYISEEKHVKFKSTQHSLSEFVERTLKGSLESYIQETARYIAKAESVINCVITKEGPRPIAIGDLPVAVRGLVQQIKSFERMAAEAAVTGDYHKALVAMTINPLVPSDTIAKKNAG